MLEHSPPARSILSDGRRTGEDARLTGLRCDEHVRVFLATLREVCGWGFEEVFEAYSRAS